MCHRQAGHRCNGCLDPVAIAAQDFDQRRMPIAAVTQRRLTGRQPEHIHMRHDAGHGAGKAAA